MALIPEYSSKLLSKEYILNSISEIDSLTLEESREDEVIVWDDEDAKIIPFHFLENLTPSKLANLIYVSQDIPERYQVDKNVLAEYLWNTCDKNAFITLDQMVVIWSEADDPVTFDPSDFVDSETKRLYTELGDEYAYEIGCGVLGKLWFERNIVVINMGEIVRTSEDIANENQDICDPYFSVKNQVYVGFLSTAIHELRHLQMDTNIILPEDTYPLNLASEDEVEAYCQYVFENSIGDSDVFPFLFDEKDTALDDKIHVASTRVDARCTTNDLFEKEPVR